METDTLLGAKWDGRLSDMVTRQIMVTRSGVSQPIVAETRKSAFTAFVGGPSYARIYRAAFMRHTQPMSDHELKVERANLEGGIYQELAFLLTAGQQPEGQVLISPSRSDQLFNHYIYPTDEKAPDGMIITGHQRVEQILYYPLSVQNRRKINLANFSRLRNSFPEIFGDASLTFVLTSDADFSEVPSTDCSINEHRLPFTIPQLRKLVDDMYSHPNPNEDIGRLGDVQKHARYKQALRMNPHMGK